ncbi:crossover junction endonuclease MUS81 [Bacillus rossius redtenbacheri]|uniref:crossover junction endonuclease MUS81 n=1 Tax=Bacillus rossius redtenbacheri TaxID=93214 RepID=UPI002FDE0684
MTSPGGSNQVRKRITLKNKACPNPLFEMWLQEWKESADKKGSDMKYCFGKALASLRKFPLRLKSGKECGILQNFGNRICVMLDRKLAEYKKEHPELDLNSPSSSGESPPKLPSHQKAKERVRSTVQANGRHKTQRDSEYVPAYRSGPYALLLTLLKNSERHDYKGYMTKSELQTQAQDLSDTSFTKPLPESRYTAWSSMATLVRKGLVVRNSNPAKFSLSDKGKELTIKLRSCVGTVNDAMNGTHSTNEISSQESVFTAVSTLSRASSASEPSEQMEQCCRTTVSPTSKQVRGDRRDVCSESSCIIFEPGSFDVVLLVDKHETAGGASSKESDATVSELTSRGARFELRHLKVGDFAWVCRHGTTGEELVLPYIVERKRTDDLGKSIKDGRFHEQKFRLKQCGVQNVIYLVESHGTDQHTGLPLPTLQQAVVNTQVVDGFTVKRTASHRESMSYLATLTRLFRASFRRKTLAGCPKRDLPPFALEGDFASLLVFSEFSKLSGKAKNYSVREMFVKHLLQLRGLSVEKALAIVGCYESPRALLRAYEQGGGEKLLAEIRYGASNRLIGPVISRAIYYLYTNDTLK